VHFLEPAYSVRFSVFVLLMRSPYDSRAPQCIVVGTTHNQSENHPEERATQYAMIVEFMQNYIATLQADHTHELRVVGAVFAGDFNFGPLRGSIAGA
jgi:hypothetical protein